MKSVLVEKWEEKLNHVLQKVDRILESRYGSLFAPHPARPSHGITANPQNDGLFRVTASFSPGFGSELGRGYVLQLDVMTLDRTDARQIEAIQREAVELIRANLEGAFPGRGLTVKRDGNVWKIVGDLSLSHHR